MHPILRALFSCGLVLTCSTAFAAEKPTATLSPPEAQASGAAKLSATVTAKGAVTKVVFHYGRTTDYGTVTAAVTVLADEVAKVVSTNLTGLIGGLTYHCKVVATNTIGEVSSPDQMFTEPAFVPALAVQAATKVAGGKATLNGTVTDNGTVGVVSFEWGLATSFDKVAPATATPDPKGNFPIAYTSEITGLKRGETYQFRLVFTPPVGVPIKSAERAFVTTNNVPVAKADTVNLTKLEQSTLDVLHNDKDADGDVLLVASATTPKHGSVRKNATSTMLLYTPADGFVGTDSFSYTVEDGFGGTATATVTIHAAGAAIAGLHGAVLKDADGKEIGYFQIAAQKTGSFTGTVDVNGERHAFSGTLSPEGIFSGTVFIDGQPIPLHLTATVGDSKTAIAADFGSGYWTAAATASASDASDRGKRAGRYTVEFAGGGTTGTDGATGSDGSVPSGGGWAAVKMLEDGMARVKGRLADGRSFTTSGVLSSDAGRNVVTFFADPRDTLVFGSIILGDKVSGSLQVEREASGRGNFPNGYSTSQTAAGAPYVEPKDGRRAISAGGGDNGRLYKIDISGGGLSKSITRDIRLTDKDKPRVLNPGTEDMSLKIDQQSGRFTLKFTGDAENDRFKGTGVLIQSSTGPGHGTGVFAADDQIGKISITATSAAPAPTPRPTPTPAPIVVVP